MKYALLSWILFFSFVLQSQDWNGNSSTNYIFRTGTVSIGGDYSGGSTKFNLIGSENNSHFYHSANENIYLRPGKNSGTIFMDKGIVTIGGSNTGGKFNIQGANFTSHFLHGVNQDTYIRPGKTGGKVIMDVGNVGIGTTTPDAKLAVNGNIHAKEVKVDLIGWSDFVFEKGYALPTLEEVENHIKEKGHLQDIPSAEEVEENGINLGEMNAKLLQKIEELMLYTIQQQKEIDELKQQLSKV